MSLLSTPSDRLGWGWYVPNRLSGCGDRCDENSGFHQRIERLGGNDDCKVRLCLCSVKYPQSRPVVLRIFHQILNQSFHSHSRLISNTTEIMSTTTATTTVSTPSHLGSVRVRSSAALKADGSDPTYGDWRDDLVRDGFAVVKGAIPRERADRYADAMYSWLEGLYVLLAPCDMSTDD